jgi:hypothetical protein
VFAVGGFDGKEFQASAETYNPAADAWTSTTPTAMPRFGHTATLLNDGRVLVAGGYIPDDGVTVPDPVLEGPLTGARVSGPSAELYDPPLQAWLPAGDMASARAVHTATLLPDGRVLVAGGTNPRTGRQLATAELYDPANRSWRAAGSMSEARGLQTATLMKDGTVLVAGGYRLGAGYLPSVEQYEPTSGAWHPAASLRPPLSLQGATLLLDGGVLVVGSGQNGSSDLTLAEIFRD